MHCLVDHDFNFLNESFVFILFFKKSLKHTTGIVFTSSGLDLLAFLLQLGFSMSTLVTFGDM